MNEKLRLEHRYYLTQDGTRLVEGGDPDAHSLMFRAGDEIPRDEADRWGLLPKDIHVTNLVTKADEPKTPAVVEETKVVVPESKEAPKGKEAK